MERSQEEREDESGTNPRGEGAAKGILGDLKLGSFVKRIAHALDFWSHPQPETEAALRVDILALSREALEKRGTIAGLLAIAKVADAYGNLDEEGRDGFFAMLKNEFSVDEAALSSAIAAYQETPGGPESEAGRAQALVALSRTLESPRHSLFKLFNTIPSGIKFLVDLRSHLHVRLRNDPSLAPVEYELRRLLESFFNLGFLNLERIGWDSPATLLEKLIEYEAVHRITNWDDLKHRLVSDRACYAFLHPAMPNEPVIFVEVALVKGIADNIQTLLDPDAPDLLPDQADTAIFYGISNAQKGLRGIPFGNLLIKKVVSSLRAEAPNLTTFSTLSPLPRFRVDFIDGAVEDGSVASFFKEGEGKALLEAAQTGTIPEAVRQLLKSTDWFLRPRLSDPLAPGLLRAARHYLAEVRKGGNAVCPVAHFHASNGARLERINWLGDTSDAGLAQSAGIMVNYLYDMERFEHHQNEYRQSGKIDLGRKVRAL